MQSGIIRKHLDLLQTKLSALLLFIVIITEFEIICFTTLAKYVKDHKKCRDFRGRFCLTQIPRPLNNRGSTQTLRNAHNKHSKLFLHFHGLTTVAQKSLEERLFLEKGTKICLHVWHELTKSITALQKGCPTPENNVFVHVFANLVRGRLNLSYVVAAQHINACRDN
uniref:Uncharacterized protein n=1 Tax=Glossina austeni TaxID=7395 RepID=A0A1A9UPS1_GLOAU